jgi:hypothetical protein
MKVLLVFSPFKAQAVMGDLFIRSGQNSSCLYVAKAIDFIKTGTRTRNIPSNVAIVTGSGRPQ